MVEIRMKPITLEEKDRAYKLAKTCKGFLQLSKLTGRGTSTLQTWNKERRFTFKIRFCENCSSPITKSQPEETTLCQICTMETNKNKYRERKKTA